MLFDEIQPHLNQLDCQIRRKKQALKFKHEFLSMKQKEVDIQVQALIDKRTTLEKEYENETPKILENKSEKSLEYQNSIDLAKKAYYQKKKQLIYGIKQIKSLENRNWNISDPDIFDQIESLIQLIESTRNNLPHTEEYYTKVAIKRSLQTSVQSLKSITLRIKALNAFFDTKIHQSKLALQEIITNQQNIYKREKILQESYKEQFLEIDNQEKQYYDQLKLKIVTIDKSNKSSIRKAQNSTIYHYNEALNSYKTHISQQNSKNSNKRLQAKIRISNIILHQLQEENYCLKAALMSQK